MHTIMYHLCMNFMPGLITKLMRFINSCETCQKYVSKMLKFAPLYLHVPTGICERIAVDTMFIAISI